MARRRKRYTEENSYTPAKTAPQNLFAVPDVQTSEGVNDLAASGTAPTLTLQRQIAERGNGFDFATLPLFPSNKAASLTVQPKLTVGPVGDRYEQEADRVATQVVDTINQSQGDAPVQREEEADGKSVQRQPVVEIQRMDANEEDEMQMKPLVDIQRMGTEEDDDVQMKAAGEPISAEGGAVSPQLASQIQTAKGSGQPLEAGLQRSMGQAMGADFSGVKIHHDAQSNQLNNSIQAKAFTTGSDVFFKQGAYNPSSKGGQELIAHELTHVVQQGDISNNRHTVAQRRTDIIQRDFWEEAAKRRKGAMKAGFVRGDKQIKEHNKTSDSVNETLGQAYYQNLYQNRESQYFELSNSEIPAYFEAANAIDPHAEYEDMTSEKLLKKCKYVINNSLVPDHWASGFDPSRMHHADDLTGHLTPVIYPENISARKNGPAFRGDRRPPWDPTMENGLQAWAVTAGATKYSKDILRHLVPKESPKDSAYVSTSETTNATTNFSKSDGFKYDLNLSKGGIDVTSHFLTSFSQTEQEIAVVGTVPLADITNVISVKHKRRFGGMFKDFTEYVIRNNAWFELVSKKLPKFSRLKYDHTWKDLLMNAGSIEDQLNEANKSEKQARLDSNEAYEDAYSNYYMSLEEAVESESQSQMKLQQDYEDETADFYEDEYSSEYFKLAERRKRESKKRDENTEKVFDTLFNYCNYGDYLRTVFWEDGFSEKEKKEKLKSVSKRFIKVSNGNELNRFIEFYSKRDFKERTRYLESKAGNSVTEQNFNDYLYELTEDRY